MLPTREMRYGLKAIDITKEKSKSMAGQMVFRKVFSDITEEFLELQKFFPHIISNVRDVISNGMHMEKSLPDIRKNFSDITEE